MAGAFQLSGFQVNAFQVDAPAQVSAFQPGAFQSNAFQLNAGTAYTASAALGVIQNKTVSPLAARFSTGTFAALGSASFALSALNAVALATLADLSGASSPGTAAALALTSFGSTEGLAASILLSGFSATSFGSVASFAATAGSAYKSTIALAGIVQASTASTATWLASGGLADIAGLTVLSVATGILAPVTLAELNGLSVTLQFIAVPASIFSAVSAVTPADRGARGATGPAIGSVEGATSPGQNTNLATITLGEQSSNVAAAANTTAKPQSSLGETAGAVSTNVAVTENAAAALVSASAELTNPFSGEKNFASLDIKGRVTGDGFVTTPALTIPVMGVTFTTTGNGAGGMAALIPPQGTVEELDAISVAVNAKTITPMKDAAMGSAATARQTGLAPANISAAATASGVNVAFWQTLGVIGAAGGVTSNGTGLYPVAVMVNAAIALSAIAQRITAATVAAFASLEGISGQGAAADGAAAAVGGVAGASTAATANKVAVAVHAASAGEQATASQSGVIVQSIIAALNWAGVGAQQTKATVPALGTADTLAGVGNRVTAAPANIGGVVAGQGATAATNAQPAARLSATAGATVGPVGLVGRVLHVFGARFITAFDYARLLFSTNNALQSIRPRVRTLASATMRRRSLSRAQARIRSLP